MENKENELRELLSETELEHFESLAPSYKKIFINHAFKSKVEKTRLKNIDEVKEAMELKCKNLGDYKRKISTETPLDENLEDSEKIAIYFTNVENQQNREIVSKLYTDLLAVDGNLAQLYAWNQPMIKYKETFICGLTVAKNHMTIAFEKQVQDLFEDKIRDANYGLNLKTFKIKYDQTINFELLAEMVRYSIELKKDSTKFWL